MADGVTPKGEVDGRWLRHFAQKLGEVLIQSNRSDYDLGRMVAEVVERKLYRDWPRGNDEKGFDCFEEWCWNVLHFSDRKASFLAKNYRDLSAINPSDDTLSRALRVGWSKLIYVLRVARSENALLKWIDRIEDKKLTEISLRAEIALAMGSASGPKERSTRAIGEVPASAAPAPEEPAAELPDEEGVDAQVKHAEPEPPTGPATAVPKKGKRVHYPLVFDDQEAFKITIKALNVINQRIGQMGPGRAIALMATEYLARLQHEVEGGSAVLDLEFHIRALEHTYGVKLIVDDGMPKAAAAPGPKRTRAESAAADLD